jgi:hypothetical protein
MPIPRPSVEGILGEFRQQDYATVDGRLRTFVRTDRTLIRKTISFLCFKIEPTTMRSSFADMNMHNLRRWMKGGRRTRHLGARGTFHGLSPLHVRSERSPLHDVRQHAHADGRVDATRCMREFFFADELAGVCRVTSEVWWSQTESNRRPPACKAGALPTELWPRTAAPAKREWWAWEDLNFRPHAYQARALTN